MCDILKKYLTDGFANRSLVVTIFGFTPDSVFPLRECVVQFVAVCSVATGVGLAVDVMLLLKFSSAGGSRFKVSIK